MTNPKRKFIVAMSGGVDSSTVAAMLKHQGHEVIGVTLQLYESNTMEKGVCCTGIDDAKNVAKKLDIPHHVLNCERKFKKSVIDDFAELGEGPGVREHEADLERRSLRDRRGRKPKACAGRDETGRAEQKATPIQPSA